VDCRPAESFDPMLCHVVLFRPRPDLTSDEVAELVRAVEEAHRVIPSIRRFHVGRRVVHGAGYEAVMRESFDYAAIIEFEDLAGLKAYLDHPAHRALGPRFMRSFESSVIFDYEMTDAAGVSRLGAA
jgi:hypothetical protein